MSDTINIGGIQVSKFYLGGSSDVKIYLGETKLYPHLQEPCFAVVGNINTYTARTYVDVYETSSDKWYKLNNLNAYEEYGIYGSGRTITYYEGKLTIDDGYEYQYSGGSWVNVGEVSGNSVVEYIETPTSSPYAGIELLTSPSSQSTPMYYEVDCLVKSSQGDNSILGQKSDSETVSYQFGFQAYSDPYYDYGGSRLSTNWSNIGGLNNRIKVGFGVNSGDSKVVIKNLNTSIIVQSTTATPRNVTIPLLCNAWYNTNTSGDNHATSGQFRYYGIKIYDNNVLVGDYIPAKNPSTNEYTFYETISQRYCSKIGTGTIAGHEEIHYEYPKYYSEQSDPPNNLYFNTMEEAEAYKCPWVGMKATIDDDKYIFSGDSQSGYEWVEYSRLPAGYTEVEYIRQNSNYNAYINTGVIIFDNTTNTYTITTRLTSEFHSNLGCATIISCERVNGPYDGLGYRYKCSSTVDQLEFFGGNPNYSSSSVDNGDGTRTITFTSTGNSSFTTDVPLSYMAAFSSTTYGANASWRHSDSTIYSATVVKNGETVRDFVPAKRDSDSVYGLYDLITDTFYTSPNGNNFIGGNPV